MFTLPYAQKIEIPSLDALADFATQLAAYLKPGDVVALNGALGTGKTTLVQKLGASLKLDETVASPTFVLMNEYLSGPFPIVHVDLYRLEEKGSGNLAEELQGIIDEGCSLVLVEWACYGRFLDDLLTISIELILEADSDVRTLRLMSNRAVPNLGVPSFSKLSEPPSPPPPLFP